MQLHKKTLELRIMPNESLERYSDMLAEEFVKCLKLKNEINRMSICLLIMKAAQKISKYKKVPINGLELIYTIDYYNDIHWSIDKYCKMPNVLIESPIYIIR